MRIVILRSNPIAPDPRVEKEARALTQAGHSVQIVAWDRGTGAPLAQQEDTPFGRIQRLLIPSQFGSGLGNIKHLIRWQWCLLAWLWSNRKNYDAMHACDFDTVLPAVLLKLFAGKKLVYDIYDFYADMLRFVPTWMCDAVRWLDLKIIGFADAVILVDESRVAQIAGSKPKHLAFIYNSPETLDVSQIAPSTDSKGHCVTYVGLLQNERAIQEMIEVVGERAHRQPAWRMELAGFGGDEASIAAKAAQYDNIHMHGKVDYATTMALSAQADFLFATYDPSILNHRYSSANKLFEAMMLGKPIVVCDRTGMDEIVARHNIGFVVPYADKDALRKVLDTLEQRSPAEREAAKAHSQAVYREHYSWNVMRERLIHIYQNFAKH